MWAWIVLLVIVAFIAGIVAGYCMVGATIETAAKTGHTLDIDGDLYYVTKIGVRKESFKL